MPSPIRPLLTLALFLSFLVGGASTAGAQEAKKHPHYDHLDLSKKGLAIDGYDPVAYFPEGGGKAKKGDKKITVTHRGVTYRFKNEANKKAFLKEPAKYEPQYGGWCAWAMAKGKGSKVEPDPESFTIESGKLYLFYDGLFNDTRKSWKRNGSAPKLGATADKNWARIVKPKKG